MRIVALAFTGLAIVVSSQAHAAHYIATMTGTLRSSFDATGVFGQAGTSYDGQAISLTFDLDTSAPGAYHYDPGTDAGISEIVGTTGLASLPAVVAITVNGRTAYLGTVGSNSYVQVGKDVNVASDLAFGVSDDGAIKGHYYQSSIWTEVSSSYNQWLLGPRLQELSVTPGPDDGGAGSFAYLTWNDTTSSYAYGSFDVHHLSIMSGTTGIKDILASLSAVPEPASWAMMLGGFGLVGGAIRRRRVSVNFV